MKNKTPENQNFRFTFKPATRSQKPLILEWLKQPFITEWLHGVGLQNTIVGLDAFFNGSNDMRHWIAYDQDVPFGYLLTSDVEKQSPQDKTAITLDLFICRPDYMGKGYSVRMVHEFLLSQFPDVEEVLIDPEIANSRAVHVYKKAGFKVTGEFIAKWHPVPHYQMSLQMKDLIENHQKSGKV